MTLHNTVVTVFCIHLPTSPPLRATLAQTLHGFGAAQTAPVETVETVETALLLASPVETEAFQLQY